MFNISVDAFNIDFSIEDIPEVRGLFLNYDINKAVLNNNQYRLIKYKPNQGDGNKIKLERRSLDSEFNDYTIKMSLEYYEKKIIPIIVRTLDEIKKDKLG